MWPCRNIRDSNRFRWRMAIVGREVIVETRKIRLSLILTVLFVLDADSQDISSAIAPIASSNSRPHPSILILPHNPSGQAINHPEFSSVTAASSQDTVLQTVLIRARRYTSHKGFRIRSTPVLSAAR